MRRIGNKCKSRIVTEFSTILATILQISKNNSRDNLDLKRKCTPSKDFEKDIEEIIKISKKHIKNVVFNPFSNSNYKELLFDGLYLNLKDHQLLFEIVRDFIIEKNIIARVN